MKESTKYFLYGTSFFFVASIIQVIAPALLLKWFGIAL